MPAFRLRQLVERVSLNVPTPMRAPVEGPGLWALESAMNELADAIGLDPLDVRWPTSPRYRPSTADRGRPTGYARRTRRAPAATGGAPGSSGRAGTALGDRARHGHLHHGGSFRFPSAGRVRLRRDGAVVEANVHDIGTGVQTVLSQIAAEELGIPPERVQTRSG